MKIFLASPHTITRFPDGVNEFMKIFMAGGITGNLKPFWKDTCEHMKNGASYEEATEEGMKVFLAGGYPNGKKGFEESIKEYHPFILESYYYCDADTERLLPYFGDFLLDSGAFTFMQGKGGAVNWNDYVERYADFINRNKIEKFFELDIDSVTGYETVIQLRKKLEALTGRQCIPVWHKSRGIQEYKKHCQEYSYVGIGGYVIKELTPQDYEAFPVMINYAHSQDAKVHCLGYTKLANLRKHHFDSVDSTAWTTGNRFGYYYKFNGKTMIKIDAPPNHRLANSRHCALNNYTEWIKFQKYADKHL